MKILAKIGIGLMVLATAIVLAFLLTGAGAFLACFRRTRPWSGGFRDVATARDAE